MEKILEFLSDLLLAIYKAIVDAIALVWPSTPDELKLSYFLSKFPTDSFFYYFLIETATLLGTVIALVALYKLIKILPFT